MAKPNSLNKYLANTPYAVLSMEALQDDQLGILFLSLENELSKLDAMRTVQTTIQNVKGINRDIALTLEGIADGILPFKAVGFTTAPSKTGLVLTQESLGKAISEGFKRVMSFLLELLKRFGGIIVAATGLAPRAKAAAEETKTIVARYRVEKAAAAVVVPMNQEFPEANGETSFDFSRRDYLSLIMQAGTIDRFYQIVSRWNSYCRNDLTTIQSVLRNFSNPNKTAIDQIAEAASERAEVLARAMQREHITANPADIVNTFKKSYFDSIEQFVTPRNPRAETFTAQELALKFAAAGNLLTEHSTYFTSITQGFSKANQDIERQIGRLMSTATNEETKVLDDINTLIAIHTKMASVLATHLSYLVQTHEAYNRKALADLDKKKGELE